MLLKHKLNISFSYSNNYDKNTYLPKTVCNFNLNYFSIMKNPKKNPLDRLGKPQIQRPDINIPKLELKLPKSIDKATFDKFSPQLQVQLNEMLRFDDSIKKRLQDPKEQELLLKQPREFFLKNNIKVSPFIERKLKDFNFDAFIPKDDYIMPNGTKLSPKVTITIN
jgi:hypothetical protein